MRTLKERRVYLQLIDTMDFLPHIYTQGCTNVCPYDPSKEMVANKSKRLYCPKHALKHMKEGASIINGTSINAYKGNPKLIDYTVTKGVIVAFTRALALQVVERRILVNGVVPGPVLTPLISLSFPNDHVEQFGKSVPIGRVG